MTPERYEQLRTLFLKIRELPAVARAQAVSDACGGDQRFANDLMRLLQADDGAAQSAERSQDDLDEAVEGAVLDAAVSAARELGAMEPNAEVEPGEQIDRYRVLSRLGHGGFGDVFLAEQIEPIRRLVALKVVKPGMDSRAVIARFEQERQALAVMDHPNVARVLDAGTTRLGRPYFVMEYVKGEPITEFADRHRLTIRQRLELFIPVCEAVQHAHMKGIIHRDIKPSNLLVTEIEGKAVPKVIDFGVAKAMAGEDWAHTAYTQSGMIIGTPEYMSPEQVAGELDVDTRADVYSLGVTLYELLTGELPFDSRELRKAALAEIQRIIREVTPPKPSSRLAHLAGERTTTIAQSRSATRERLATELRRELDWIPLMALRKERERRYESPQAMADDMRRYLEGRALRAAPDSGTYLARKFIKRHKLPALAASAALLSLSAGLAVALWQRGEAIAARDTEKERADQLKQVSAFQSQMLRQIDTTTAGVALMQDVRERFAAALEAAGVPEPEREAQTEALANQLSRVNATDTAAAMIDRTILRPAIKAIDEQFKDQPAVDATLRQALADLYERIGLYDSAFPLQESALTTRRRVLGEEHQDTLLSVNNMGALLIGQGKLSEAEPHLREALEARRRTLGEEHQDTLISINNIGTLLVRQNRLVEAEPYLREALEARRRTLGDEHQDTLISINNMGSLLLDLGRPVEAEPYLREALETSRRTLGDEHEDTLGSINNMGSLLLHLGRPVEAEPYYREALETRRRTLGGEHPSTLTSINNMGIVLWDMGNLVEAESFLCEALEKTRRTLGDGHPSALNTINNLGALLQDQGKFSDAELYYLEAVETSRRTLGSDHAITLTSVNNLGNLLLYQDKLVEAEPYLREALEASRRTLGDEHRDTLGSINVMGGLLQAQGRLVEAESYYREALETRRRTLSDEHPDLLVSLNNMGVVLQLQGELAEAEPYMREALEKSRRTLGDDHANTLVFNNNLGALLRRQGKHQEAINLLAPAEQAAREAFTGGNARRLALLLTTLGRARVGLGYEVERFTIAEANLLEAYPIFVEARGEMHTDTLGCVQGLVDLYTTWDSAEPGKGFEAKAAKWKSILDAANSEAAQDPAAETK